MDKNLRSPRHSKFLVLIVGIIPILLSQGCSVDSAKNHYLLAEKLWTDQKYAAAVSEFEKVITKDPQGKLGLQATFRAATTQSLFLSQNSDAIRKYKNFIQFSRDSHLVWDAQLQIGEILFSKTEQYDQSILHYRSLLKEKPKTPEASEFLFRIAKSQFFLFQFNDAVNTYRELIQKYPASPLAEKALYEIGATYFTRGEQNSDSESEGYEAAKEAYEKFIQKYPKSTLIPEAQFGIATCFEEMDQLDDAYNAFTALKTTYPSPHVIEVKLSRIKDRMSQRNSGR